MSKSVQQLLDETMCRPGYTWDPVMKRCMRLYYGGGDVDTPPIDEPEEPIVPNPPEDGDEITGRGSKRKNANGIVQKGTSMGKSINIK